MRQGPINFIDTELTNAQFANIGYPAFYILKNAEHIVTKFIIFDLNGVRTDYHVASGGGSGVTEEWVNSQITNAISALQDNTLEFPTFEDFPATGEVGKVYIDLEADKIYIWDSISQEYISQSWDYYIIQQLQTNIASAQMAFQNLENSKLNKDNTNATYETADASFTKIEVINPTTKKKSLVDKPTNGVSKTSFTHNILVGDWSLVSGKYEAEISNVAILADSFVDVIPSNDSTDIVRSAQVFSSVLISEGSVKVFSKFLPSETISVTVNVI